MGVSCVMIASVKLSVTMSVEMSVEGSLSGGELLRYGVVIEPSWTSQQDELNPGRAHLNSAHQPALERKKKKKIRGVRERVI